MSTPAEAVSLDLPLDEAAVRRLHVGDFVLLNGRLYTARDAVHRHLAHGGDAPCDLRGSVLYHCGPVVVRRNERWRITAAGPTTSIREEPYMADLIGRFQLRGIIGKGGMGAGTLAACQQSGCVYLHAVGGAAQVLAARITDAPAVYFLERFGAPEAVWELVVRDFPVMVTMDAHGTSLHADVDAASRDRLQQLLGQTA